MLQSSFIMEHIFTLHLLVETWADDNCICANLKRKHVFKNCTVAVCIYIIQKYTARCFAQENSPNEPTFPLFCSPNKPDDWRNSHGSLNIKLFILATPQSLREEMQAGPISISCDPLQHVVMLANQILRQQVKGWPLWAVCFHKWICLIWEINRLLSNLLCDWSCDLVTEKWWMLRQWHTRVTLTLSRQDARFLCELLTAIRQCSAAITIMKMSAGHWVY